MQRRLILISTCAVLVAALTVGHLAAQQASPSKLIGTWKLISAKYNGEAGDFGKQVILKHVTGSHFTWLRYDADTKKVSQTAGGPYSVKGDTYSETPMYGVGEDFDQIRDKTHNFTWRVEGNKWYSNGELAGLGFKIEEVWERVSP